MTEERAKLETMMPDYHYLIKVFKGIKKKGMDIISTDKGSLPSMSIALKYLDIDITKLDAREVIDLTKVTNI